MVRAYLAKGGRDIKQADFFKRIGSSFASKEIYLTFPKDITTSIYFLNDITVQWLRRQAKDAKTSFKKSKTLLLYH